MNKAILLLICIAVLPFAYAFCDYQDLFNSCHNCSSRYAGEVFIYSCWWTQGLPDIDQFCADSKTILWTSNETGSYATISRNDNIGLDTTGTISSQSTPAATNISRNITCEDPGKYYVRCEIDGLAATTSHTIVCNNETTTPTIQLNSPSNNTIVTSSNQTFTCNATDNIAVKNITIYTNITGTWLNNKSITAANSAPPAHINFSNYTATLLLDGSYVWNCIATDYSGNTDWADTNYTLTVNKTGWDDEHCGTNPGLVNYTTIRSCGVSMLQDKYYVGVEYYVGTRGETGMGEISADFFGTGIPDSSIAVVNAQYYSADYVSGDCCYSYVQGTETQCTVSGTGSELCGPGIGGGLCDATNQSVNQTACMAAQTGTSDTDYARFNVTIPRIYDPDCVQYQLMTCESPFGCRRELGQTLSTGSNYSLAYGGDNGCELDWTPYVTLTSLANGTTQSSGNFSLECRAIDGHGVSNVTLYHNINGAWTANETSYPYGKNLLAPNSDFEEAFPSIYQRNETLWYCGAGTCAQTSTNPYAGTYAASLSSGGYFHIFLMPARDDTGNANITWLQVNQTYTLSYWARYNITAGSYRFASLVNANTQDGADPVFGATFSGHSEWQFYNYTFTVTATHATNIPFLRISHAVGPTGTIVIDNVQLEKGARARAYTDAEYGFIGADLDNDCTLTGECYSMWSPARLAFISNNWTDTGGLAGFYDNDVVYCTGSNTCYMNFTVSNVSYDGTYDLLVFGYRNTDTINVSLDGTTWQSMFTASTYNHFRIGTIAIQDGSSSVIHFKNYGSAGDTYLDRIFLYPRSITEHNATFMLNNTADGTYLWNCLATDNSSKFVFADANYTFTIDSDNNPTSTLVSPASNSFEDNGEVLFNCSATDDLGLTNITLYHNATGTWQANGTQTVSGTSAWTNFSRTFATNVTIAWSCMAADTGNQYVFASNYTLRVLLNYPPIVQLISPADGYVTYYAPVVYACNASDEYNITSITLWTNTSGAWNVTGTRYAGEVNVTNGLVFLYHFNNETLYGESGSLVYDHSGNGNNGTPTGDIQFINGVFGKALNLSNGSINSSDSSLLTSTGNITIESWLYLQNNGSHNIFSKAGSFQFRYQVSGGTAGLYFQIYQSDSNVKGGLFSDTGLEINQWHHVAARANGTLLHVFVNGAASQYNYTYDGTIYNNDSMQAIGKITYANASQDEFAVYNRPLSTGEIGNRFNYSQKYFNATFTQSNLNSGTYNWTCTALDGNGNTSFTNNRTFTLLGNLPPDTPIVTLLSSTRTNTTTDNLNCSTTLTDPNGNAMNVTVRWYNGSNLARADSYGNDYANNTAFLATLAASNTTKGETWVCNINVTDGTNSVSANSSGLTILNSLPTTPTLLEPSNGNTSLRIRNLTLDWTDSADNDSDPITYTLNITSSDLVNCPVEVHVAGITISNYTTPDLCVDTLYNWSVMPSDNEGAGTRTALWNFTIESYKSILFLDNSSSFGSLAPYQAKNTTSDDLNDPMIAENDGNVPVNVTLHAQDALWDSASLNTTYFRNLVANGTEPGSFQWNTAVTYFTPVNDTASLVAQYLNYSDAKDSIRIDYETVVPASEPPGNKITTMVVMFQ